MLPLASHKPSLFGLYPKDLSSFATEPEGFIGTLLEAADILTSNICPM